MSVKARGISSVLIVLGAGNANACVALEVVSKIVLFVPAWEYFIKLGPGLIARNAMGQVYHIITMAAQSPVVSVGEGGKSRVMS